MNAREISLHKIDYPDNSSSKTPPADPVEAEVGRRVWWYLVTTDWVLSQYAGPQKGSYSISPQHMVVSRPLNLNDVDLIRGTPVIERPMNYPTNVSYTLQRIRLGEMCRELTDRTPLSTSRSELMNYSQVLEVDKNINEFIEGFPSFFLPDGGPLEEVAEINPLVAPGIIIQRYVLNSLVHAHRCRLHLPYFARGSVNPAYAYSRETCLKAARVIIRAERLLEAETIPFVLTRFRVSGALHCLSMAIVVLLLDICLYKDAGQEAERKAEVADACSILEKAKNESSIAARILQSFKRVIRKHKVSLAGIESTEPEDGEGNHDNCSSSFSGGIDHTISPDDKINDPCVGALDPCPDLESSYWDEIRQSLDSEMNMDQVDWDTLLYDLGCQGLESTS